LATLGERPNQLNSRLNRFVFVEQKLPIGATPDSDNDPVFDSPNSAAWLIAIGGRNPIHCARGEPQGRPGEPDLIILTDLFIDLSR
jgi:hypothetical protein